MIKVDCYQELGYTVTLEVGRHYCNLYLEIKELEAKKKLEKKQKNRLRRIKRESKSLLKDLRSEWMRFISNDLSPILADKLLNSPEIIINNILQIGEDD